MSQTTYSYIEEKSYLYDSHLLMDSYPKQTLPLLTAAQEDLVRSHGAEHNTSFSSFTALPISDTDTEIEPLNIRKDFIESPPTLQLEFWDSEEKMITPRKA